MMARFRLFPYDDDSFMASTVRMGWEWLLTPLLVYHNDHLMHHLFPTVPFYKMRDGWYMTYDELSAGNVSDLSAFGPAPANIDLHQTHSNLNC